MSANSIRILKITGLSITLLLPVLIIFFLNFFGENVYSVPIFYKNGIPEDSIGCQKNGIPHRIPDFQLKDSNGEVVTQKLFNDRFTIVDLFSIGDEESNSKKAFQLNRVMQKYKFEKNVQVLRVCYDLRDPKNEVVRKSIESFNNENILTTFGIAEDIFVLAHCGFVLLNFPKKASEIKLQNNTFVLVDHERRIRGYYDGRDFEETDRLIVELDILLKEQ